MRVETKYKYQIAIILISFIIVFQYAYSFDLHDNSDAAREYSVMLQMAEENTWRVAHNETLLRSCMFTTYLPAMIHRHFGLPAENVYRYFPLLFMIWTPLIVFLMARRYLSDGLSLFSAMIFMAQNYYLWAAGFARIGIAVMFLALVIWLAYRDKQTWKSYALIGVVAALIPLAHYGTAFYSIALFSIWFGIKLIAKAFIRQYAHNPKLRTVLVVLLPLCLMTVIWLGFVMHQPLKYGSNVVETAITEIAQGIAQDNTPSNTEVKGEGGLFSMESRGPVVQVAFGKTFPTMNVAQRIEFVFSWLIILTMSFGVLSMVVKRKPMRWLILAAYLLVLAGIISPYLSNAYGVTRIYYSSSIVLMVGLGYGMAYISQKVKVPAVAVGLFLFLPYFLCTTGLMHLMFGYIRDGLFLR